MDNSKDIQETIKRVHKHLVIDKNPLFESDINGDDDFLLIAKSLCAAFELAYQTKLFFGRSFKSYPIVRENIEDYPKNYWFYFSVINWNHKRPLSSFELEINLLKSNGFNPIAVTQMYMEDIYVFETLSEAYGAADHKISKEIDGYFWAKESLLENVKSYNTDVFDKTVLIYWL